MRASTHHQPYQGYPYVTPPVHDAPSIDPATAARWNNLPRKQVGLPVRRTDPVVYVGTPDGQDGEARNDSLIDEAGLPKKPDPEPSPVVYIDMPEASGSLVVEGRRESSETDEEEEPEPSTYRQESKRDPADEPVVYIDLPDADGTDVARSPQNEEPEYVQETIFFDPFENRRIEMNKEQETRRRDSESEDDTVSTVSGHQSWPRRPQPPIRPNTLDLYGAGSSGGSSSQRTPVGNSSLPPMMSKETLIYGQSAEDRFPTPSIPVSEFPEPPPAYAEIDTNAVVDPPRREELPPRTQVILPTHHVSPTTPVTVGIPNSDRKYLNCHHCGMRVHSLVVKENGTITHAIALMCLILFMIPIVIFIYCTDFLKIKNHYCPNCNKIIGYQLPLCGNKIVYVN